jgi:hypothetical protein
MKILLTNQYIEIIVILTIKGQPAYFLKAY